MKEEDTDIQQKQQRRGHIQKTETSKKETQTDNRNNKEEETDRQQKQKRRRHRQTTETTKKKTQTDNRNNK